MLVKKEIIINANIKKVWEVFSQLEKWPEWGGYILNTKWVSNKKWETDSIFTQNFEGFWFFREFKSTSKIIEAVPYSVVTWAGTRLLIRGAHTFKFEKIGNKTKVSNMEHFTRPLAWILTPVLKSRFEQYFEQFLNGLRREVENQ